MKYISVLVVACLMLVSSQPLAYAGAPIKQKSLYGNAIGRSGLPPRLSLSIAPPRFLSVGTTHSEKAAQTIKSNTFLLAAGISDPTETEKGYQRWGTDKDRKRVSREVEARRNMNWIVTLGVVALLAIVVASAKK